MPHMTVQTCKSIRNLDSYDLFWEISLKGKVIRYSYQDSERLLLESMMMFSLLGPFMAVQKNITNKYITKPLIS